MKSMTTSRSGNTFTKMKYGSASGMGRLENEEENGITPTPPQPAVPSGMKRPAAPSGMKMPAIPSAMKRPR